MLLNVDILDTVTQKAKESPRLRMNYNLHESYDDSVQRMFNALEPGTEIPIARHQTCNETLILMRGKLRVNIYDNYGNIIETCVLDRNTGNIGFHIEKGRWHKVESLEPGTVLFETREGPYKPVEKKDIMM